MKVQRHVRMRVEERFHELRLVGGQVVEDHVDLLVGFAGGDHVPEEAHEVPARVPGRRLALNLPVRTFNAA